jgi:hypothetical protein
MVFSIALFAFCCVSALGCCRSASDVGESMKIDVGSTISTLFSGAAGAGWVQFEVLEVQGKWVRTQPKGQGKALFGANPIWINLDSLTYLTIEPKGTP